MIARHITKKVIRHVFVHSEWMKILGYFCTNLRKTKCRFSAFKMTLFVDFSIHRNWFHVKSEAVEKSLSNTVLYLSVRTIEVSLSSNILFRKIFPSKYLWSDKTHLKICPPRYFRCLGYIFAYGVALSHTLIKLMDTNNKKILVFYCHTVWKF